MRHRTRLYVPQMLVASALVVVMPVAVVWGLRARGVFSALWIGIVVAVGLAAVASLAGTAYWERRGSGELVFGELLLWEWLRRLYVERQLDHAAEMLDRTDRGADTARVLEQLAVAIDAQDPYLNGHSRRVARYAEGAARKLWLSSEEVRRIELGALLHDVGKLHVPSEILRKPGRLTEAEYERTKVHAEEGAKMVGPLGDPGLVAIVRHHHERFDGTGYPAGLSATEIPLGARIVAVADTFDAVVARRSYRPGARQKHAIDVLTGAAGTQLDPTAVQAFLRYYSGRRATLLWALLAVSPTRVLASSPAKKRAISQRELAGAAAVLAAVAATAVAAPTPTTSLPRANRSGQQAALHPRQPPRPAPRSTGPPQGWRGHAGIGARAASAGAGTPGSPSSTTSRRIPVVGPAGQPAASVSGSSLRPRHAAPSRGVSPPARVRRSPRVTTSAASAVTATSAALNGVVNAEGADTYYRFEYGTSPQFGSTTPSFLAGSDSADHLETETVPGLEPNTTYHFRAMAWNAAAIAYGRDRTFTTRSAAPAVATGAATDITATGATLTAMINPQNEATTYYFQYGTTTRYGSRLPASAVRLRSAPLEYPLFGSTRSSVPGTLYVFRAVASRSVTEVLSGVEPNRLYHFRVVASNSAGTSYGEDRTLTTATLKPAVSTGIASAVTATAASLAGTVNPENQPTTYHIEYGTTASYGSRAPAADAPVGSDYRDHSVSEVLSGLSPGQAYHYRLVATNGAGTSYGDDHAFTTRGSIRQPVAATGGSLRASEGQALTDATVARFSDPDTSASPSEYSATIDWGDGSPQSSATITGGGGAFAVLGSHTYVEDGRYPVSVNITGVDHTVTAATASGEAVVADAALHATDTTPPRSPQSFHGPVATFTDDAGAPQPNTARFTATIDWGDGTPASPGTPNVAGTSYAVSGSHNFSGTGYFTIRVHILDDGGSIADTSGRLLVFGTPHGGSFVIGDGNAATADPVTFWGASWSKLNLLSGGAAPSAFKGFEDSLTPTRCGQTWTGHPGDQAPPPAGPLPSYMAVIVSSSISQSGSVITGDSPHLAIVQTNPGYQPDPGHPGTGTVISQLC